MSGEQEAPCRVHCVILGRRGKVFADRFHTRALSSLRAVKSALVYVLQNARKHFEQKGVTLRARASKEAITLRELWRSAGIEPEKPTRDASTWLLRVGWRRLGVIQPSEVPAS